MEIFHGYVNVYQRVNPKSLLVYRSPGKKEMHHHFLGFNDGSNGIYPPVSSTVTGWKIPELNGGS